MRAAEHGGFFGHHSYSALGMPRTAEWRDVEGRHYELYRVAPIAGLL